MELEEMKPTDTADETVTAEASEESVSPAQQAPAETMEDYAQELEASFKKIYEGDILTGTVIGVSET